MSDDTKLDGEIQTLKQQVEELKQKAEKAEYYESEAKKAFEKRDAVKKQLEDIEKKNLEEQGKYKELYESKEKEFSETAKRLEALQKERDEAVKVRDSFVENTRNELLKDLPEEHKEIAQSLDLEKLRRYKELIGVKSKTDKATDVKPKVNFKPFSPWKEELSKIKL